MGVDGDTAAHAGREGRGRRSSGGARGRGLSFASVFLGLLFGFGVREIGGGACVFGGGAGGVGVGVIVVVVVVVVVGEFQCVGAHGAGGGGDRGVKGDREAKNEGAGAAANGGEAVMEVGEVKGGDINGDVGEAFLLLCGALLSLGDAAFGSGLMATTVEKVGSSVLDFGVPGLEEGGADEGQHG